jgi:hypothetical protein
MSTAYIAAGLFGSAAGLLCFAAFLAFVHLGHVQSFLCVHLSAPAAFVFAQELGSLQHFLSLAAAFFVHAFVLGQFGSADFDAIALYEHAATNAAASRTSKHFFTSFLLK